MPKDLTALTDDQLIEMANKKGLIMPTGPSPFESMSDDELIAAANKKSSGNPASAALEGAGQALTLGYLPQLQAGAERLIPSPTSDVDERLRQQGFKLPEESYVKSRDEFISRGAGLQKENPYSYGAGMLAGTALQAPMVAGLAGAPAASALGRVGQAVKGGAIMGAAQNPGDTAGQESGLQLGERLKGASSGAAVGGVAQGALGLAGKTGEALGGFAKRRAVSAAGFQKADINRITKKLGPVGAKNKAEDLGDFAIKQGLIKSGDDIFATSNRISSMRDNVGKDLGGAYEKAQESFLKSGSDIQLKADPGNIAFDALKKTEASFTGKAGSKEAIGAVQREAENLLQVEPTFKGLLEYRQSLDDVIYSAKTASDKPARKALEKYRGFIDDKLDEMIEAVSDKSGGSKVKELKEKYSKLSTLSSAAKNKVAGELGNSFIGLRDSIFAAGGMGGLGALTSEDKLKGFLGGAALGAGSKVGRKWGDPIATKAAYGAGGLLGKVPSGAPTATGAITAGALSEKRNKNGR